MKIFNQKLQVPAILFILSLTATSAYAVPQCWQLSMGEEVCLDLVSHGFVTELTGVDWVPAAVSGFPTDMCIPVDGALVHDDINNLLRMEYTRMIGQPILTHAHVHHTVMELSPASMNGIWADQHGANGGANYIGGPSPNNPCL